MQDIGEKEGKYMNNAVKYTSAPDDVADALERARVIDDFLPSPRDLIRKQEKERITITVDKESLDAFRAYARIHNAKYQTMINDIVTSYAHKHLVE